VLPVLVAVKVGTTPLTALLFTSIKVIVTVELEVPSAATGPEPVIVEFAALLASAVKLTFPPECKTGEVISRVFTSALVDFKVQVDAPVALELEHVP
jgi:hypothetical protein